MSTIPVLVGITGRARHGKNTVAELLTDLGGYEQHAFAAGVKEMALALDPLVPYTLTGKKHYNTDRLSLVVEEQGWEGAKQIEEVRRILQVLGTECVRDMIGEDSWVNAFAKKTTPLFSNGKPVVATDVRFPNEAAWVRRMGGEVWRVTRPDFVNGVDPNHPSEAKVDELFADLEIANNGTLEDLEEKIRRYTGERGFAAPMARYGVAV